MRNHFNEAKLLRTALALACLFGLLPPAARRTRRSGAKARGAAQRVEFTLREGAGELTLETPFYSVSASTNAQGKLVLNAPTIPIMQALYIHQ